MDKITTRKAIRNDLQILLEFEQGIVGYERHFDDTLRDGEIHYYNLAKMITAKNAIVIVAELAGAIVGSGYARIENAKPYLKHTRYAYLGFMYVKPAYRGKGVNKMILEALKKWCVSKNITEMRLEVYTENVSAIKAYGKAGFHPILTWMRLGLDDGF